MEVARGGKAAGAKRRKQAKRTPIFFPARLANGAPPRLYVVTKSGNLRCAHVRRVKFPCAHRRTAYSNAPGEQRVRGPDAQNTMLHYAHFLRYFSFKDLLLNGS